MKSYRIKFETSEELMDAMGYMILKGFVFTTDRIKGDYRNHYKNYHNCWRYIFIGHLINQECKMIMNTSNRYHSWNTDEEISWNEFLDTVLPTW